MTLGVDGPMVLSLTDSILKDLFKVDQKGRIQIMEALRTVQRGERERCMAHCASLYP